MKRLSEKEEIKANIKYLQDFKRDLAKEVKIAEKSKPITKKDLIRQFLGMFAEIKNLDKKQLSTEERNILNKLKVKMNSLAVMLEDETATPIQKTIINTKENVKPKSDLVVEYGMVYHK